jgi:CBS domain-containing protein
MSARVGSVMRSPVVAVGSTATLREAARVLQRANIGTLAILDGPEIVGILSERDLVGALADDLDPDTVTVADTMSRDPRYLIPTDDIETALEIMHRAGMRHLPVVEEGELVGIVSIRDLAIHDSGRVR